MERHPPPMSLEQMAVLFENSGELHKRYHQCISYATFTQTGWNGQFSFGIVSRTGRGNKHICKTYEEALDILKKYNGHIREVVKPMTPRTYALLQEAVTHHYSPTSRSRWHVTQYDFLYVSPAWEGGVEIHYTYNSRGKQELPWALGVENFGVFVQHYDSLNTHLRIPFTEEDLKPRRDQK
jgi:hypothetical protein